MPYAGHNKIKQRNNEEVDETPDEEMTENVESESADEDIKVESDPMIKAKKPASNIKQQCTSKNTSKQGKRSNKRK